jgi:ribosome biogenesis GTPase
MNVHRSGLQVVGENIDQHVELSGSDHELQATVGDWLLFNIETQRVVRRLERKSLFRRRAPGTDRREQLIAANVDTLFIVTSCNKDFNASRIERYLALAAEARIQPVIVLTKMDLSDDSDSYKNEALKLQNDIRVECVNAKDKLSLAALKTFCTEGHTIALIGSSGVGKSTLINNLTDSDQLTAEISEEDGKGIHTTTSRSLHLLQDGGILIDTPGIRELKLTETESGIEDTFEDVTQYLGVCKFKNCQHETEAGCAIKTALESGELDQRRWESYQKLQNEQEQRKSFKK